jgi:hypothetical protein
VLGGWCWATVGAFWMSAIVTFCWFPRRHDNCLGAAQPRSTEWEWNRPVPCTNAISSFLCPCRSLCCLCCRRRH